MTKVNFSNLAKAKAAIKSSVPTFRKPSPPPGVKEETIETIHKYLWEMLEAGMKEVSEDELVPRTGYKNASSKGYRNAVGFIVRTQKYATKGDRKLSLTKAGIEHCRTKFGTKPTSNDEAAECFKANLIKLSENKIKPEALNTVWSILEDGQGHRQEDLVAAAGYKRADSKPYAQITKWCNKLGLTERQGGLVYFTDKVFPFGRPCES